MASMFHSWPSIIALVVLSFASTFCFVHATRERIRLSWRFIVKTAFPAVYAARFLQRDWLATVMNMRSTPAFARTMAFAHRLLSRDISRRHGPALNAGLASATLA